MMSALWVSTTKPVSKDYGTHFLPPKKHGRPSKPFFCGRISQSKRTTESKHPLLLFSSRSKRRNRLIHAIVGQPGHGTAPDRDIIATLTQSNKNLTETNKTLTEQLQTARLAANAQLQCPNSTLHPHQPPANKILAKVPDCPSNRPHMGSQPKPPVGKTQVVNHHYQQQQ
jgi:hypothetical protein